MKLKRIKTIRILYCCNACLTFYQDKKRCKRCHPYGFTKYYVKMYKDYKKQLKSEGEK